MSLKKSAKEQQAFVTRTVTLIVSLLLLAGILRDLALLPFELKNDLWPFLSRTANNFYVFIPPQASLQTL